MGSTRLPALARFRSSDHLKGKAGVGVGGDGASKRGTAPALARRANSHDAAVVSGGGGAQTSTSASTMSHHADQVRDIVEEATGVS